MLKQLLSSTVLAATELSSLVGDNGQELRIGHYTELIPVPSGATGVRSANKIPAGPSAGSLGLSLLGTSIRVVGNIGGATIIKEDSAFPIFIVGDFLSIPATNGSKSDDNTANNRFHSISQEFASFNFNGATTTDDKGAIRIDVWYLTVSAALS